MYEKPASSRKTSVYKKWMAYKEEIQAVLNVIDSLSKLSDAFIASTVYGSFQKDDLWKEVERIQEDLDQIGSAMGVNWKEQQKTAAKRGKTIRGNTYLRAEQVIGAIKTHLLNDEQMKTKQEQLAALESDDAIDSNVLKAFIKDVAHFFNEVEKIPTSFTSLSKLRDVRWKKLTELQDVKGRIVSMISFDEIMKC